MNRLNTLVIFPQHNLISAALSQTIFDYRLPIYFLSRSQALSYIFLNLIFITLRTLERESIDREQQDSVLALERGSTSGVAEHPAAARTGRGGFWLRPRQRTSQTE